MHKSIFTCHFWANLQCKKLQTHKKYKCRKLKWFMEWENNKYSFLVLMNIKRVLSKIIVGSVTYIVMCPRKLVLFGFRQYQPKLVQSRLPEHIFDCFPVVFLPASLKAWPSQAGIIWGVWPRGGRAEEKEVPRHRYELQLSVRCPLPPTPASTMALPRPPSPDLPT